MRNPTVEVLSAAVKMRENGNSIKQVLATPFAQDGSVDTKNGEFLSYSQFWLFASRQALDPKLDLASLPAADLAAAIVKRRVDGFSWGEISVQADLPESRVRKMYEETTGIRSKGLRTGQGGRFLTDDGVFYADDRKPVGTPIPVEAKITEVKASLYKEVEKARARRATATAKKASKKATTAKKEEEANA